MLKKIFIRALTNVTIALDYLDRRKSLILPRSDQIIRTESFKIIGKGKYNFVDNLSKIIEK